MTIKKRFRHKPDGFTLVELLLTLVLILCLAAASVCTYTAVQRNANLDEGLDRLESLIRFAKADAATTGRKIRLQFEAVPSDPNTNLELRRIKVTWERDILNSPGVFLNYTNRGWSEALVNDLIGVAGVRMIGPASPAVDSVEADESAAVPDETEAIERNSASPAITFYPNGSCDSADLVIASRNPDDPRLVELRLSGILGTLSRPAVSIADDETGSDLRVDHGPGEAGVAAEEEWDFFWASEGPEGNWLENDGARE